jgi:hypothetical protein
MPEIDKLANFTIKNAMVCIISSNFVFFAAHFVNLSKKCQKNGKKTENCSTKLVCHYTEKRNINRKFRVPRKQGAHFLDAGSQIQDSWFFDHQHEISDR